MIGLINNEYGWKRVLNQEKTQYELVNFNKLKNYSLIILNSQDLPKEKLDKIRKYILNGGSMLTDTLSFKKFDKNKKISRIYVKSIYGKSNLFRNINNINIRSYCYKIIGSNLIYKSKFGKGFIISLPFDLNKLMLDERSKKQYLPSIYSPLKENISLISKGDLRRLIINCFHYLHFIRNIPYIHIWYYPKNYESVFAYRIDLDIYNKNEINNIINIIKNHKIKFTWFASVENCINYEEELKELSNLNQDVQSHSNRHFVYNSYEENYNNVLKAKKFLSKINKNQFGFAAPFGHWNRSLGKVLEKLNYFYSSEFSLSYDDMPFYPNNCSIIQLPIYPTCIGLFKMRLYSVKKMKNYINYLTDMQYKKQMPLFLYDHPNEGIGVYPKILDFTLKKIKNLDNVLITNMNDFANFWKKREKINFKIKNNKIITNNESNDIYLRIVSLGYKESRIPLKNQAINFDKMDYKEIPIFKDVKIRNVDILKSKILFLIYYLNILIKSVKRKIL